MIAPSPWKFAADLLDPPIRVEEYASPGELAMALDPSTVQTPALKLIDQELVDIRDAIKVMRARNRVFVRLMHSGMDEREALLKAEASVPPAGNDRLILSMPPQEGKTDRIGRRGVLWLMRQFPGLRVAVVSYDGDHAQRISYQIRADIELFNGEDATIDLGLRLAKDQKAMSRWLLAPPHGGGIFAIGIGGGLTGRPTELLIIDDPVKDYRAADSVLLSAQAGEWWETVARPRLAPWAPVLIVSTRWHEADLSGRMQTAQAEAEAMGQRHYDKWRVLNIPAQADHKPELGQVDILGRQPGEFMVSARGRTLDQWEATKAATSPRFWSALYQGRPSPDSGDVFERGWWKRYAAPLWTQQPDESFRVEGKSTVIQSWDMTFKDTASGSFVVGQVWMQRGASVYLLDQTRARLSFTDTLTAVRLLTKKWPQATIKLVEDKANGTAVIDTLKREIAGMIPVNPGTDSKAGRARGISPFVEAGNVFLPTTDVALFDVKGLIEETAAFPNGAHDDQVDALSQALVRLLAHPRETNVKGLMQANEDLKQAVGSRWSGLG
jgi:predicted phage terminase large subunit-like protein